MPPNVPVCVILREIKREKAWLCRTSSSNFAFWCICSQEHLPAESIPRGASAASSATHMDDCVWNGQKAITYTSLCMYVLGHNPYKYFQGGQNEYVLFSELNKIKYFIRKSSFFFFFVVNETKHSKSRGLYWLQYCILYVIWILLWIFIQLLCIWPIHWHIILKTPCGENVFNDVYMSVWCCNML